MVYLPPAFTETRPEILRAHIERYDFALLMTHGSDGLISSHLPLMANWDDRGPRLLGHLARPNPQLRDLANGTQALAVFSGPHAYVSPSFYESSPAVPTWNYADVHAYGDPRLIEDPIEFRDLLQRLCDRHEAREPDPWKMQDLSDRYVAGMLKGIVGVEITVTRLEGKFKLSQNRPIGDRQGVVDALERRQDPESDALAALMRRHSLPAAPSSADKSQSGPS